MYTALIADDSKVICDSIASALRQALPEVKIAGIFYNGTDAYEYVKNNPASILLLDIEMPGYTGLDIAEMVKQKNPETYIIILTAFRDFEYAKRAIACHVEAFLNKPFTSRQLIAEVEKAISIFDEHNVQEADNRNVCRALVHSFLSDIRVPTRLCLCKNTTPIAELQCTEVIFSFEGLNQSLSQGTPNTLLQTLQRMIEYDTRSQTALLMECTDYWVKLLLFSKDAADISGLSSAEQIISSYTDNAPQCSYRRYPSFSAYRTERAFAKAMDGFFKCLASENPKQAKDDLSVFLSKLSEEERVAFADFLSEQYQLDSKANDCEALSASIDILFHRTLDTHTNNYLVEAATDYINLHYGSFELSLESTAEALSVSRVYLSRVFKEHTNQNFSNYLLNLRLQQAKKLLCTTAMSTAEISKAVGYGNPVYFRTSFKNHIGVTPRQFRQLHYGKDG